MAKRIILLADSFFPNVMPPEAVINTRVADLLSKNGQVRVYAGGNVGVESNFDGIELRGVNRWGLVALVRIILDAIFWKASHVVIMYDASGFDRRVSVTLIPLVLKILRRKSHVVAHFTNGCCVPYGRSTNRMLRILMRIGVRGINDRLGMLACSDRLVFYCNEHRLTLTMGDGGLLEKSIVSPVPPTVAPGGVVAPTYSGTQVAIARIKGEVVIVFFGLLYPEKGVDTLLRAVSLFRKKERPFRLLVIGGAGIIESRSAWNDRVLKYYDYLKYLERELGLQDVVDWIDYMAESELSAVLMTCDVVVFPFRNGIRANNSSFSVALHHGAPIVATYTDETDGFLRSVSLFRLVPPDSPEQLCDAISLCIGSVRTIDQKSRQLDFARDHFSWDGFVLSLTE